MASWKMPGDTMVQFTLTSNTGNPLREKSATLIAEDLSRLGFKVTIQPIEFRALAEKINRKFNCECVLMGLGGGGLDPASQMNVLKSSEPLHQWFPSQRTPATDWETRIDTLMRTLDLAQRKKSFDEVQAILAAQLPMIYTVAPFHFAAALSDLASLRPSVITNYRLTWNVEELFFKKP